MNAWAKYSGQGYQKKWCFCWAFFCFFDEQKRADRSFAPALDCKVKYPPKLPIHSLQEKPSDKPAFPINLGPWKSICQDDQHFGAK